MAYRSEEVQDLYIKHFQIFKNFEETPEQIWSLTEILADTFKNNPLRNGLYWANLDCQKKIQAIEEEVKQPRNPDVFVSVRKDLYLNPSSYSVNVSEISQPTLSIIGLHDFIMAGHIPVVRDEIPPTQQREVYSMSGHYPHLEEPNEFSKSVNEFLGKLKI